MRQIVNITTFGFLFLTRALNAQIFITSFRDYNGNGIKEGSEPSVKGITNFAEPRLYQFIQALSNQMQGFFQLIFRNTYFKPIKDMKNIYFRFLFFMFATLLGANLPLPLIPTGCFLKPENEIFGKVSLANVPRFFATSQPSSMVGFTEFLIPNFLTNTTNQ